MTLAAALEPARRASRIQPVEALTPRLDRPAARSARLRWLAVVFGPSRSSAWSCLPRGAAGAGVVQALAVYAILLVGTLLIPFVLPAIVRVAGAPFAAIFRFEERLARSSVVRDRSRTALTLGSLTIGLAMIVALGGVGEHARAAAAGWISDVVPGDLVVTSIRPIAADDGIAEDPGRRRPGIARVSPIATFDIALQGRGPMRPRSSVPTWRPMAGLPSSMATATRPWPPSTRAVRRSCRPRWPSGSAWRSVRPSRSRRPTAEACDLTIVGIVERSIPGRTGEAMLVGWGDAADSLGVAGADVFAVRFAPDAPASARDALTVEATALALEVVPLDRIEGAISDALGRIFGLFDALAAVAVLIAALGIVNTLTMNVIERVREIGILRAAGMTRGQVWRSVVVEAGVLGLAGALLGIVLGLVVGALMVVLSGGRFDVASGIPWSIIGLALVLGVAVAMLAAAYPARIASRLSIVRAVQYD